MPTMASVSAGNDEKVFLQSTPYRPDNSKCADNGLLYSDTEGVYNRANSCEYSPLLRDSTTHNASHCVDLYYNIVLC